MENIFKTKGVSFNLSDPLEKQLFEFAAQHKNFSGLMKRLLYRYYLERELRK